jgi:hypothetical protein
MEYRLSGHSAAPPPLAPGTLTFGNQAGYAGSRPDRF